MNTKKEYTLTVELLQDVISLQSGKKIKSKVKSGHKYSYSGVTKKECIQKAKAAGNYGSRYAQEWALEEI